MTKKITNSGASLPASATIGLPPAQASHVRSAAPAKFRADRIAGGERDDHVDDHRQQRAQQELRVVPLRIDEHDRLGDERSDRAMRPAPRAPRRRAVDGGREAVAQARRRDARGRQVLLVIEGDDLRTTLGLQVALEIGRNIDRGNGVAGPDRRAPQSRGRRRARRSADSGDAATCSTKAREVSERSSSTTTTPSPRITGWLNTAVSTTKANSGTPKIKISAARSCSSHRHSRVATSRNPGFRRPPHQRVRQSR